MFGVFKLSFVVDILAFFWLCNFLGYSLKKLENCFSYHLVTLCANKNKPWIRELRAVCQGPLRRRLDDQTVSGRQDGITETEGCKRRRSGGMWRHQWRYRHVDAKPVHHVLGLKSFRLFGWKRRLLASGCISTTRRVDWGRLRMTGQPAAFVTQRSRTNVIKRFIFRHLCRRKMSQSILKLVHYLQCMDRGATTLSIMGLVTALSITVLSAIMLSVAIT